MNRRLRPGETNAHLAGTLLVDGLFPNAVTARDWSGYPFGDPETRIDVTTAFETIVETAERVNRGDLGAIEAMLTAQAVSLNAMFVHLARGASLSTHMDQKEQYLRLALKAQAQCRATAESLAEMKNPPLFTRQANIAGQQIVNNGTICQPPRAGNETTPNELLEASGERMDRRTTRRAGEGDLALAAVGALNRPANARR
jgi:hypothetical protein